MDKVQAGLQLNFLPIKPRKHVKISGVYALVKKEWVQKENLSISKIVSSIESFLVSWLKVVILRPEMVEVVNQYTAPNLKMKTLLFNTLKEGICQWPTQVQIQMDPNFS